MMFKQRRNFVNNIFWNAQHNLREKGLTLSCFDPVYFVKFLANNVCDLLETNIDIDV